MKLQIDTTAKTIKVEGSVKFDDLIKVLNKLLPKEWRSYSLESEHSFIYWADPIPYYPYRPWRIGDVTYTATGESVPSTVTCYNIEVIN